MVFPSKLESCGFPAWPEPDRAPPLTGPIPGAPQGAQAATAGLPLSPSDPRVSQGPGPSFWRTGFLLRRGCPLRPRDRVSSSLLAAPALFPGPGSCTPKARCSSGKGPQDSQEEVTGRALQPSTHLPTNAANAPADPPLLPPPPPPSFRWTGPAPGGAPQEEQAPWIGPGKPLLGPAPSRGSGSTYERLCQLHRPFAQSCESQRTLGFHVRRAVQDCVIGGEPRCEPAQKAAKAPMRLRLGAGGVVNVQRIREWQNVWSQLGLSQLLALQPACCLRLSPEFSFNGWVNN